MQEREKSLPVVGSLDGANRDQPKNPGRRRFIELLGAFSWGFGAGTWVGNGIQSEARTRDRKYAKEYNDLFSEMIEKLRQKTDLMLANAMERRWNDTLKMWLGINDFLKEERKLLEEVPERHDVGGLGNIVVLMEQNARLAGLALTYILEQNRRSVSVKDKYSFDKLENELLLFFNSFNDRYQPGGEEYKEVPREYEEPAISI